MASRTRNTTRNIGATLFYQITSIILIFANRTAILWVLGAEFAGLASLFSSILNVLNMAELGFNTAIVYSLYKPMADKNHKKICEIVSMFKKIYSIIGVLVLLGGLAVMPFLPYLINGSYPSTINLYLVYSLYLANTVISYFMFAYKECLLVADQRQDIAKNIRTTVSVVRYVAQLLVLIFVKNFYIYLIIAIVGTVVTNALIHASTKKHHPYYRQIRYKVKIPIEMKKQIKGLMINKICDTFRNSFDSLIISSFIGLTATAIYGNYYYIYASLYGIMTAVCSAMSASIGNSIIENSENKNYSHLLIFSQIFAGIIGFVTVALACFYQPFMKLWAGEELLLPTSDMLLFCVYFYIINMNNIRNQYISGTGIWWKLKSSYIVEAIANLLLNVILGRLFGITGVIIATIATIFLFNYLQRNKVLFSNYFKHHKLSEFYKQQFLYLALTAVSLAVSFVFCENLPFNGVLNWVVRAMVCVVIPNLIFYYGIHNMKIFKETKRFVVKFTSIVPSLRKKRRNIVK